LQLVLADIVAVVFCKTKQKQSALSNFLSDNHTISARTPFSRAGNTLLDETAAKVGIDYPFFSPLNSFAQCCVGNVFLPDEARHAFRLKASHVKL
jgi:hypothetical protein